MLEAMGVPLTPVLRDASDTSTNIIQLPHEHLERGRAARSQAAPGLSLTTCLTGKPLAGLAVLAGPQPEARELHCSCTAGHSLQTRRTPLCVSHL